MEISNSFCGLGFCKLHGQSGHRYKWQVCSHQAVDAWQVSEQGRAAAQHSHRLESSVAHVGHVVRVQLEQLRVLNMQTNGHVLPSQDEPVSSRGEQEPRPPRNDLIKFKPSSLTVGSTVPILETETTAQRGVRATQLLVVGKKISNCPFPWSRSRPKDRPPWLGD